ncbi:hypothetical protein [Selenomonas sp. KH1T6]|uniref:hypothetical protein n=1 Tax=Selenomonas sp. KH1T6 TaxID=3158784 RepID=UPI0008A7D949|nr:hypothetical protein SAMN05216583_103116 [Selenomonas ruminantium]
MYRALILLCLLWCYIIKHMEAGKAAISILATPVVGAGMLLVFAGIFMAQRG